MKALKMLLEHLQDRRERRHQRLPKEHQRLRPVSISLPGTSWAIAAMLESAGRAIPMEVIDQAAATCDFYYGKLLTKILESDALPPGIDLITMHSELSIDPSSEPVNAPPFVFFTDREGLSVACWGACGRGYIALYGAAGDCLRRARFEKGELRDCDPIELPVPHLTHVRSAFLSSIKETMRKCTEAAKKISFDRNHGIAQTNDGSLVIYNIHTRLIDNDVAPAVLTITGDLRYVLDGEVVDRLPPSDALATRRMGAGILYQDPEDADLSHFKLPEPSALQP